MADRWLQEIVIFAGMTGLRLGEILNARWEDVDLGQGTLLVRSSEGYTMKAGRMRKIPLNDTCVSLLMNKDSKQGFIFRGRRRGKANTNYVSAQFRKAVRLQGMDQKLHFHSLRHTFSTMLIKKGASLYQIQKLLGHSSPRVTETYAHLQPDELHHVVSRVSICHDANDAPLNQEQ
ncbi:MAG: site-specific integrase [Bacteroidota bacterium]